MSTQIIHHAEPSAVPDPISARIAGAGGTSVLAIETESEADGEDKPVPVWPAPLSRAAYFGIFGDIVDALTPQTEADPAALLLQMLAMFGNVIGRTAHFRVEADTHYLNLFVALVGASAKGRKGVSSGQARRFFQAVDERWIEDRHVSGLSSGEGLIYAVRDAAERQQAIKLGGRTVDYETVIDDPGVADKRLYVTEPELASTLKVMTREGNTPLSPVLRNAWDGAILRTLTKNSPLKASGPHISVVGSITQHEVRRYLDATERANGFGNRFLWVCVKRSQYLPDGGAYIHVDPLVDRLRALAVKAREVGEMTRDRQARELWHAQYRSLSAGRPGLLGSIIGRSEAQTMRLACLFALGNGSRAVQEPHLRAALEAWRYCFDSAAYIFGDTLGDTKADALLAALKAATTIGLTRSEMTHHVFHGHVAGRELARILGLLQDAELAFSREEDADGPGRPAQRWFIQSRTCERSELIPVERNSFASFARSQAPSAAVDPANPVRTSATTLTDADGGETEVFSL